MFLPHPPWKILPSPGKNPADAHADTHILSFFQCFSPFLTLFLFTYSLLSFFTSPLFFFYNSYFPLHMDLLTHIYFLSLYNPIYWCHSFFIFLYLLSPTSQIHTHTPTHTFFSSSSPLSPLLTRCLLWTYSNTF